MKIEKTKVSVKQIYEIANSTMLHICAEIKTRHPTITNKQLYLGYSRVLNLIFQAHYGLCLEIAQERVHKMEKETDEQPKTD